MVTEKELLELVVTSQVIQRAKEKRVHYAQQRKGAEFRNEEVPPERSYSDFIEEAAIELRDNHKLLSNLLGWST